MITKLMNALSRKLAAAVSVSLLLTAGHAYAQDLSGVYRGFLAFDFKGEEIRESMMISFGGNQIVIMGAEEGQDEPVDAETGIVTKNDFEAANLGLWRLSVQSVNGRETAKNPFDLGITIDYCLTKMSVDSFFEEAPSQN